MDSTDGRRSARRKRYPPSLPADASKVCLRWPERGKSIDDEEGNMIHTFMVITVPSGGSAADICERMPAILTKEEIKTWMNADASTKTSWPARILTDKLELFPQPLKIATRP